MSLLKKFYWIKKKMAQLILKYFGKYKTTFLKSLVLMGNVKNIYVRIS